MPHLVSNASDKDGYVFAERDPAVFSIGDDGFLQLEIGDVQFRGIQLPGSSGSMATACVVRAFVDEGFQYRIPLPEVGEDHDRFMVGVNSSLLQHW